MSANGNRGGVAGGWVGHRTKEQRETEDRWAEVHRQNQAANQAAWDEFDRWSRAQSAALRRRWNLPPRPTEDDPGPPLPDAANANLLLRMPR